MSEHLDDGALRALMAGTLPAARLLEVDDHLSACPACRTRAQALPAVAAAAADLRSALQPEGAHLSDDDLQAYVDGTLGADARAAAVAHAASCAVCAEQVRDLAAWVPARRVSPRVALGVAAAVLLAVLGSAVAWLLSRGGVHRAAELPGFATLAPGQQRQVRAALDAGAASPPPLLAALAGSTEVLMGPAPSAAPFALVSPVATAVLTDRPRLEWQPLPGATSYAVAIADEQLRPVAASTEFTATEWTPDRPLPRGRTYAWQVTARRGDDAVVVPSAPAPAARFLVLEADVAARLGAAERAHPESHLLLGIVFLEAGARDDARRHLLAVPAADPAAEVARRTLERLSR